MWSSPAWVIWRGLFQSGTVGEGSDTDSLNLPGVQQQLLQALVDTGKPVVVVMTGGRPYNLQGLGGESGGADACLGTWAGRRLGDSRRVDRPR
ncbi:Periplasmic beta-glucosidase precursor [Kluyvera cryocrescens]|uniref:Periplasmic beta-glucosidase n=1 Tax=Kluyvera cryocrescens TaxID=580 RepID=A0A485BMC2_KLUCR|nr:Periplasmic beta-glucosidase precursor [Kluyvera cryocrescens]